MCGLAFASLGVSMSTKVWIRASSSALLGGWPALLFNLIEELALRMSVRVPMGICALCQHTRWYRPVLAARTYVTGF